MYGRGEGVEQNNTRAAQLFTKACNEGNIRGCLYSGDMYSKGDEIYKDIEKARRMYGRACSLGDQSGCDDLKKLH
jgi:hypothetical protein